ncbi:DUF4872 domain-containing protein [Sutcliffiella sp. BMC8]|uniref:DUF4872 domain-containing protein n=1 Tax=Sutcliffiella sp. BMC8 TaxID=3073243 RepID=UPI0030CD68B7
MKNNFSNSKYKLCYLSAFLELINFYSNPINEGTLFALTEGLNFEYCYINNGSMVTKPSSMEDWICILGAKTEVIPSINKYFNINFKEMVSSKEGLIEIINKNLLIKSPVIVSVNVHDLYYHPLFNKFNGESQLILQDIDKNGDVCFLDCHIPSSPVKRFEGVIPINIIENALWLDSNQKSTIYTVHKSDINEKITKGILLNSMYNNCRSLLNDNKYTGIAGLKNLAFELESWSDFWTSPKMQTVFQQAYFHIQNRGGPALTRLVYAEVVRDVLLKHCKNEQCIYELYESFIDISKNWTSLAGVFFRGYYKNPELYIDKIRVMINEISNKEEEALYRLIRLIEKG